ncbi:Crp/Fnr family transcriptional regulator [Actinomadura scrupuli]|uniref:Crp/Fnr family transcriptional regulator n=1 Tax=Actinomadura scrupuli TaxID=559629 RepID=UPI003D951385
MTSPGSIWPSGTLLGGLPESVREGLLRCGVHRTYPDGSILVRQGEIAPVVHLLLQGTVKETKDSMNGAVMLQGIRVGGDLVGEAALFGRNQPATLTTCRQTLTMTIPGDELYAYLGDYPEAWAAVAQMLSDRLDWANQRRLDFFAYTTTVRLAGLLVQLADRYGSDDGSGTWDLGVRISQDELGSIIGAGPDSITKALRELRERGLVRTRYRNIGILDPARLRAWADDAALW